VRKAYEATVLLFFFLVIFFFLLQRGIKALSKQKMGVFFLSHPSTSGKQSQEQQQDLKGITK